MSGKPKAELRARAIHVRKALGGALQTSPAHSKGRPLAAHVQAALGRGAQPSATPRTAASLAPHVQAALDHPAPAAQARKPAQPGLAPHVAAAISGQRIDLGVSLQPAMGPRLASFPDIVQRRVEDGSLSPREWVGSGKSDRSGDPGVAGLQVCSLRAIIRLADNEHRTLSNLSLAKEEMSKEQAAEADNAGHCEYRFRSELEAKIPYQQIAAITVYLKMAPCGKCVGVLQDMAGKLGDTPRRIYYRMPYPDYNGDYSELGWPISRDPDMTSPPVG